MVIASISVQSQTLYPYSFSSNTSAYQELSGATPLFQGIKWDDTVEYIPIGFPFKWAYDNYSIDSIYVDTYGMLHAKFDSIFIWGLPSSSMSAYWADLCDVALNKADSTLPAQSEISYQTTGNVGSRIFKVQFKNCGFYNDTSAQDVANFQIWLYEGSNIVEYHYGGQSIQDIELNFDATGPHIGLEYKTTITMSGNNITNFTIDSFSNLSGTNTSFTNNFYSTPVSLFGALPNSYFMLSTPDSGQVFRYTPLFQAGLNQQEVFKNTIVYPTQVQQTVFIKSDLKVFVADLLDMNGNVLRHYASSNYSQLTLPALSTGNYFLRLQNGNAMEVFKLQKQ